MYLDNEHEERYNSLLKRDNTYSTDTERKSLLYIISGNLELYKNINKIYNFKDNQIIIKIIDDEIVIPDLPVSSSARSLAYLGLQLYNNCNHQSVMNTFSNLDDTNFNLALNAIKLRFNM